MVEREFTEVVPSVRLTARQNQLIDDITTAIKATGLNVVRQGSRVTVHARLVSVDLTITQFTEWK